MPVKKLPIAETVDIWMPLYISDSIANTGHLTDAEFRAYSLIRMHQWRYGPMTIEDLRNVSRLVGDASSIPGARLMHMLSIDESGLFSFSDLATMRDEWIGRKQKAREKAKHSAEKRWARERERKNGDASSIPQASKKPLKRDAQSMLAVCPSPLQVNTLPPSQAQGEGVGSADAPTVSGSAPSNPEQASGRRRHREAVEGVDRSKGNGGIVVEPQQRMLRQSDIRLDPFKSVLTKWYAEVNEKSLNEVPWGPAESAAMRSMLEAEPGMLQAELERRLVYRLQSIRMGQGILSSKDPRAAGRGKVNPSARLSSVVKRLSEFSSGPINSYGDML